MVGDMEDGEWEEASLGDVAQMLSDWRVLLCLATSAVFWASVAACALGLAPFGLAGLAKWSVVLLVIPSAVISLCERPVCR